MEEPLNPVSRPLRHWTNWLGPCASFLCLIHCFGMALIPLAAPEILNLLPHAHELEIAFLVIAFLTGLLSLKRANVKSSIKWGYVLLTLFPTVGLYFDHHKTFHMGLVSMACYQLFFLIKKHRTHKHPPCCEHNH